MAAVAWRKLPHVFEMRFAFCQYSERSLGVKKFLTDNFTKLQAANPALPILIRECEGTPPTVTARFAFGEERTLDISNLDSEQTASNLEAMTK
eukprot:UN15441